MRKVVLFMHTSLNGFTTDSKGNMNWIKADEEMFDYAGKRTQESDIAVKVKFLHQESYVFIMKQKQTCNY